MSAHDRGAGPIRGQTLLLSLVSLLSGCGGGGGHGANSDGAGFALPEAGPQADATADATPVEQDARPTGTQDCATDTDCEALAYCGTDLQCTAGCRIDPDNCPADPNGLPTICDPTSRACGPTTPPPAPCAEDTACADGAYCAAHGQCEPGCREHPDTCHGGETCDRATHRCAVTACASDGDCAAGEYCVRDVAPPVCADGCRTTADCQAGAHCDATHTCRAECAADEDCSAPQYCDLNLSSCRVPCTLPDHGGCTADEACDPQTHQCFVGCRDDAGEAGAGNDTAETAAPIPMAADAQQPGIYRGSAAHRFLCPADPDFLSIHLPTPSRTELLLTYDGGPGTLSLDVTDAAGAPIGHAEGSSPLVVRTGALGSPPGPSDLIAQVSAGPLGGPAGYTLSVRTANPQTGCLPDAVDPLDDRAAGGRTAGLIPGGRSVERFSGSTCQGDRDWICFDVEASDGLNATLETPAGCGPVDLRLLPARVGVSDPDAEPTAAATVEPGAAGGLGALSILPESGTLTTERYCLQATAPADRPDAQCEDWSLTLELLRSGVRCADSAEPNETALDARPLDGDGPLAGPDGRLPTGASHVYPDALRLCPGDVDFFQIQADAGDTLQAWVEGDADLGAALVSMVDSRGRTRGDQGEVTPPGASPPLAAMVYADTPGTWYIRVRADEVGGGAYRLFVQRDPPAVGCANDRHEPPTRDDTPATAQPLLRIGGDRSTVTNALICSDVAGQADEDWYRFTIPDANHRLCVTSRFQQAAGDLDMALFHAEAGGGAACASRADCDSGECVAGHCAAAFATASTRHDGEMLAFPASQTQAGEYLLRVYSQNMQENAYDLAVTDEPPSALCPPDYQERERANDGPEMATELGSGRAAVCDAWLCADERQVGDWYTLDVPAGEDRTVHVGYDGLADGSVALTLFDPADPAAEVFVSEPNTLSQCLNIHGGLEAATLHVQVTTIRLLNDGDARVDYTLQVAPTQLGRDARGECDPLSGGLYSDVPWPTYSVPRHP